MEEYKQYIDGALWNLRQALRRDKSRAEDIEPMIETLEEVLVDIEELEENN